jgi:hypothetical protein
MNNLAKTFIQRLPAFEYEFDGDPRWELVFSNGKRKWFYLVVSYYKGVYYLAEHLGEPASIQVDEQGEMAADTHYGTGYCDEKKWRTLFSLALEYLDRVEKDWVNEYRQLTRKFPYKYRQGVIHSKLARHYCQDMLRIDQELGDENLRKFVSMVENGKINPFDDGRVKYLTAAKYFEYCKVAYLNSHLDLDEPTKQLSGMELYKLFADGRHEGLTEIELDSVSEFSDWMEGKHPKRQPGGHPWEILRGGNTTHISLYVSKDRFGPDNQYEIRLQGNSIVRIAETLKIYLALMDHQLTVAIDEPEKIRKRLLGQDSIGIVPEHLSLHRAQALFDGHVDDVMHLYAFGDAQKEICRLAAWRELPCLRVGAASALLGA